MARESLDASENLPKEALRQVAPNQLAPNQLENEASDMLDEARSRCGRLVRDQLRMARGRISRSRGLPRLYALSANRHRTSSPDDGLVRSGHVGEDEAHGDELFQVVLDLGDHPRRPVPGRGRVREAAVSSQPDVASPILSNQGRGPRTLIRTHAQRYDEPTRS